MTGTNVGYLKHLGRALGATVSQGIQHDPCGVIVELTERGGKFLNFAAPRPLTRESAVDLADDVELFSLDAAAWQSRFTPEDREALRCYWPDVPWVFTPPCPAQPSRRRDTLVSAL